MMQADPQSLRLSRFKWREAERPKSLEELLEHATPFQREQILGKKADQEKEPDATDSKPKTEKGSKPKKKIKRK
ncbi:hypothetical protein D3C85_1804040 [compost metagenome]